ncbi:hypothetical protein [Pseudomonas sp. NBRC 100443]|uniref:hypothetical protein n=1 Tax=Pseudomonas sp. NBRC 100443 TaxID=1113665 RepID=UPI0024A3AB01|nr:hypothetical protein [Pseudomonas sp. NBRC 100443]GLU41097.1 hypothetical protein Pssp01_51900 [Pseudomonas sp. NBRC 100443]
MQRFINNFSTVLTAPLAADDDVLQVAADQAAKLVGLGGGGFYQLTLSRADSNGAEVAWEIVRATEASGGDITIQREQDGTTALAWPAGSIVSARLTAGSLTALVQGFAAMQEQMQSLVQAQLDLQEQVQELAERVSELEGGSVPGNALTNQAGEVLTNQAGDILTIGATV